MTDQSQSHEEGTFADSWITLLTADQRREVNEAVMALISRIIIRSNETGVLYEKHDRLGCIPRGNDDHCIILTCRTSEARQWCTDQATIILWRREIKALLGVAE